MPPTTPTVNIIVNGQIQTLSLTSATGDIGTSCWTQGSTRPPSAQLFLSPTIATTGRTVGPGDRDRQPLRLRRRRRTSRPRGPARRSRTGSAASTTSTTAHVQRPDRRASASTSTGRSARSTFNKGIGNPTGLFAGTTAAGNQVPASSYGTPADQTGYAGAGLISGQVTATRIKQVTIKPADVTTQVADEPRLRPAPRASARSTTPSGPGVAAANALIVSSGNIGKTQVTGDLVNSEIKSGFDYPSFAAGLEGTRATSTIGPVTSQRQPGQRRGLGHLPPVPELLRHGRTTSAGRARSPATSTGTRQQHRRPDPARQHRRGRLRPRQGRQTAPPTPSTDRDRPTVTQPTGRSARRSIRDEPDRRGEPAARSTAVASGRSLRRLTRQIGTPISPPPERRAPVQAGAEARGQEQVAALDQAVLRSARRGRSGSSRRRCCRTSPGS